MSLVGVFVGVGLAVAGAVVAGGVAGGMEASGKASAQAMVESSRLKAKADLDGIGRQQDTEDRRIRSEKKQADDWLKYDIAESKADRQEAIAFQKKLDQSMGVYQDEKNIQKSGSSNGMAFSDHEYPNLDSNQQGGQQAAV